MSKTNDTGPAAADAEPESSPLGLIAGALDRIRFGAIQLTVHDGRVTQVDVTERRRFTGA